VVDGHGDQTIDDGECMDGEGSLVNFSTSQIPDAIVDSYPALTADKTAASVCIALCNNGTILQVS
jgi:hypothetical protein